ncbi:MAG: tyrosine-protein phosphatase [Bacteroidales bacterium]|jgi:protein-tyrosine phosphatase|nr:tyrosine-protein phosphatase [Bacteroidales bacterium]
MKNNIKLLLFCGIIATFSVACTSSGKNDKAVYEGKDISNDVRILRDKVTKEARMEIDIIGDWNLYAGESVETIDFTKPVLMGIAVGTYPIPLKQEDRNRRIYFQLVTENAKTILAERHLPMEGGYNFRDIGGYKTSDDNYVCWGKLFRSDDLSNLTKTDLTYLSTIPIKTIVDFRSESEIEQAPDKIPHGTKKRFEINIEPGNILSGIDMNFTSPNTADTLMMIMNETFVLDSTIIASYKYFFELIQDNENIPLIYHCSAGKDRTGMATALILYSLGVPEETIMHDYLLSNVYLTNKYETYIKQYPGMASVFTVKEEFLQAGISKIKETYGSIENFLQEELDVDLNKMKNMFLY